MKFVRENLFLIVVAGCVLLGGIGLAVTSFKVSGDVQKAMNGRVEMAKTLQGLEGRGANAEMVAAAEKRLEAIRSTAGTVAKVCIDWNHEHLAVLKLTVPDTEEVVPAFPYDEQVYRDHGLGYVFTKTYVQAMQRLWGSLHPTTPPTEGEVVSQQLQWQNQLMQRRAMEADQGVATGGVRPPAMGATPAGPPPAMAPQPARPLTPLPVPGGSEVPGAAPAPMASMTSDPAIVAEATARGRDSAMIMKARRGAIYVDPSAFRMVFREEVPNPAVVNLWQAQLNLWVTSDVVAAINATNEEAFAQADREGKPHDVLTAAVKRLIRIGVNENYVTSLPEQGAAPVQPGRFAGEEEPAETPEYTNVVSETEKEIASILTRRGSGKDCDVLHYRLFVVMPTRWLPALERHLMARNYHTVLSVQIFPADAALPTGEAEGASSNANYYYGTEPVARVEITGEMLLLTAWERGTWDTEKNAWSSEFPPLIPAESLVQQFGNRENPALRPEDAARFPQAAAGAAR
ncbi:MAG: hypothetical protein ABSH10_05805 [Phycisphaerae bacterium]|jgi:hypothetical protein